MRTMMIIEDEKLLGTELKRRFEREGWSVTLSRSLADARHVLIELGLEPAVVLSDMNLPDGNGLDFLEEIRAAGRPGEWIFLSGYGQPGDVQRALKLGALDFLDKPLDYQKLELTIGAATRGAQARQRISDATRTAAERYAPHAFIGTSLAAQRVRDMLAQLSKIPASSILFGGETGTGKGFAAKILHYSGLRREGPFIDVNCAAFPKDLLESELFGHEPGSFSGAKGRHRGLLEQADGGTLFLDEIGEMDMGLQSKLLKALEDRCFRRVGGEMLVEVDVQLLAASNRDLRAAARDGTFRSDLYHRIAVFELTLPALRDRPEDIEPLVLSMIGEFNQRAGKAVSNVPQDAWAAMRAYGWPGNVRELRNVVERCVLLSHGPDLAAEWLNLSTTPGAARPEGGSVTTACCEDGWVRLPLDGSMALEEMDRFIIGTALERHGHNVLATARALGTTRETLRYRMQKYGLCRA